MPPNSETFRTRARVALERYFRKRGFPRLTLGLVLALGGAFAFLSSVAMLHLGVIRMCIRYPASLLIGYGIFLFLLRIWALMEWSRFDAQAFEQESAGVRDCDQSASSSSGDSWWNCFDLPSFDLDEGCLPFILVGAVIGFACVLASSILNAPFLLSEVFVDSFIVAALYRRLNRAARENWLGTAVRNTVGHAIAAAILLALAGWALQAMVPEAPSIGPAVRIIRHELHSSQK